MWNSVSRTFWATTNGNSASKTNRMNWFVLKRLLENRSTLSFLGVFRMGLWTRVLMTHENQRVKNLFICTPPSREILWNELSVQQQIIIKPNVRSALQPRIEYPNIRNKIKFCLLFHFPIIYTLCSNVSAPNPHQVSARQKWLCSFNRKLVQMLPIDIRGSTLKTINNR